MARPPSVTSSVDTLLLLTMCFICIFNCGLSLSHSLGIALFPLFSSTTTGSLPVIITKIGYNEQSTPSGIEEVYGQTVVAQTEWESANKWNPPWIRSIYEFGHRRGSGDQQAQPTSSHWHGSRPRQCRCPARRLGPNCLILAPNVNNHFISHCLASLLFFHLSQISNTLNKYVFVYIFVSSLLICLHPCCYVTSDSPKLECPAGEFVLEDTGNWSCHPMLSCADVRHMKPIKLLARGIVKNIWLVQWRQSKIVMAKLADPSLSEDFSANLQNLLFFKGTSRVSKLLGYCGNSTIFSAYYPNGNALGLQSLFARHRIDSFMDRFQLCIDYAQIIALLHRHSMVMCDSNSVEKTLSQYLVSDHLELLLNDLDALPRLVNKRTKCGRRQVWGDLVAPEQEWPFPDRPFDDSLMPTYTEKADIWKMADICQWIVAETPLAPLPRQMLNHIHAKCKQVDPADRPTADYVVRFYSLINGLL